MSNKFWFICLLLVLVIIVAETFSMILSMPYGIQSLDTNRIISTDSNSNRIISTDSNTNLIIEGLDTCLPSCDSVEYDYSNNTIPPCKTIKAKNLTKAHAIHYGIPAINKFIDKTNQYMDSSYSFTTTISPLQNNNTQTASGFGGYVKNEQQIAINSYFTDISGIYFHSNQDILDSISSDQNFDNLLNNFKYSDPNKRDKPTNSTKQEILSVVQRYKTTRIQPSNDLKKIYTDFLQDISGMIVSINNDCTDYYLDGNLNSLLSEEFGRTDEKRFYGKTSSFHKISNYVYQAINETLSSTTT